MKWLKTHLLLASLCITMCCGAAASAQVKPSTLFSDHMVLLSGIPVPIWGTAGPAEKITIKFNGPIYDSMKVEGSSIRISFTQVSGGLVAKGGDLKTFVIAGQDGKFVPATVRIDHDTVLVSSPEVPEPAAVRYAWDNYPEGANFFNSDGLPAPPFRTDNWEHEPQ